METWIKGNGKGVFEKGRFYHVVLVDGRAYIDGADIGEDAGPKGQVGHICGCGTAHVDKEEAASTKRWWEFWK